MLVAVARERKSGENRVALVPEGVKALVRAGLEVVVERGAGAAAHYPDADYEAAGAELADDWEPIWSKADLVASVQPPQNLEGGASQTGALRSGACVVGFLHPLDAPQVAVALAKQGATAFSMELMPRITRAQSMDALSSQNVIVGYQAVLQAAVSLGKFFPMLVTAAGTVSPAKVLVIGAGVAGLQACATAKRLGAVVEAYDTRPVVKEQVQSVGARFVELDLDVGDAEDKGGYAKAQSEEFYSRQRELLGEVVAKSDVVITTALVPGQPAPRLIEEKAVEGMRPGSIIVDLAAEKGGNCVLTKADTAVHAHDVTIFGPTNLASAVPFNASQMYSRNVVNFIDHLVEDGKLELDLEDELTRGPLLTHAGEIQNERTRSLAEGGA